MLRKAHNYGLHPISQKFPQCCLWNGSNVRLTDDGPLSSFQGRSSSASSFHASPPDDRWCDVLGFVPAGSVSSFSTLQIFRDASHLWGLLCPQDYLNTSVRRFISISGVSQCCHRRRAQDYNEQLCSQCPTTVKGLQWYPVSLLNLARMELSASSMWRCWASVSWSCPTRWHSPCVIVVWKGVQQDHCFIINYKKRLFFLKTRKDYIIWQWQFYVICTAWRQWDFSWLYLSMNDFLPGCLFAVVVIYVSWLVQMCDECTWHHKTFLVQLYWHLAIKLYCNLDFSLDFSCIYLGRTFYPDVCCLLLYFNDVLWLAWKCDECTWYRKAFLVQLYWHLAVKL